MHTDMAAADHFDQQLLTALDTNSVAVKKQIFDRLSSTCVYSRDGYWKIIQALNRYQVQNKLRYRYQVLIDELKSAKNTQLKTSILAFINCLINSSNNVKERNDIRNELIGLKMLDLITSMRKESDDGDLNIQCNVFEEQKQADENHPPDVNSHQDIFYNILRQVSGNAQYEIPFLHLLQHLLRIEYNDKDSDLPAIIWDSAETLVHRATTMIECKEDAEKLLRVHQKRRGSWDALGNGPSTSSSTSSISTIAGPSPIQNKKCFVHPTAAHSDQEMIPPPPGFSSPAVPPPPPPPPPPPTSLAVPKSNAMLSFSLSKASDSIATNSQYTGPFTATLDKSSWKWSKKIPQQDIPKPKSKMKSLNWCKIAPEKIIATNRPNIWNLVATHHCSSLDSSDFIELEGLFCQPTPGSAPNSCPSSPRIPRRAVSNDMSPSPYNSLERKVIKRLSGEYQNVPELQLLDSKKSLNVNIFLKQHKGSTEEILNLIREGKHKEIGAERLRNLIKILPEMDEVELLKSHEDDLNRMPIAEKFLLSLTQIPNYGLRIECMLLKEEFDSNVAYLQPAIESIKSAAKELQNSKALHEILYLILVAGNFLNSGGYAGDAVGFKMMSLLKLPEIRANKPGINLIHYVAMLTNFKQQADRRSLLNFGQELRSLEEASRVSIESLKTEVNLLLNKIAKIRNQIQVIKKNNDEDGRLLYDEMQEFLSESKKEVQRFKLEIESNLEQIKLELAEFLCEDSEMFKLEECFKIFSSFCQRFKLAVDENERRRENELKIEARKSNSQFKKLSTSSTSEIGDNVLASNSSFTTTSNNLDQKLKRRSRDSQEDELHAGLMELLKTANDLGNGTIDNVNMFGSFRRVGSGRKRPTNPFIDMDSNRERSLNESLKAKDSNNNNINKIDDEDKMIRSFSGNDRGSRSFAGASFSKEHQAPIRDNFNADIDFDSDDDKKKVFNRFSPTRRTFNIKNSERDAKLFKRIGEIDISSRLIPNGDANNNIEVLKCENENESSHNKEPKDNEQIKTTSDDLRRFWNSKINDQMNQLTSLRPTSLPLKGTSQGSHPTAIISPTKVEKQLVKPEHPREIAQTEAEQLLSPSRLPRRTTFLPNAPSLMTAAAIVSPMQLSSTSCSSSASQAQAKDMKSKLPVRKSYIPIVTSNQTEECDRAKRNNSIPRPSIIPKRITEMSNGINYKTSLIRPKIVSEVRHQPVRTPLLISTTRRPSQVTPANRPFMKQTSSSAAKTKSLRYY